jgi:hypothetical protein
MPREVVLAEKIRKAAFKLHYRIFAGLTFIFDKIGDLKVQLVS